MYHLDIPKTRQYDTGKIEVIARSSVGEALATTDLKVIQRKDDYRGVLKNSPRRKFLPLKIHLLAHKILTNITPVLCSHKVNNKDILMQYQSTSKLKKYTKSKSQHFNIRIHKTLLPANKAKLTKTLVLCRNTSPFLVSIP